MKIYGKIHEANKEIGVVKKNSKNPHLSVTYVGNYYNVMPRNPQETHGLSKLAESYKGRLVEIYNE